MRARAIRRSVAFVVVASATAVSLLASAEQTKKPAPKPAAAAKKPAPSSDDLKDAGAMTVKEEKASTGSTASASLKDGGGGVVLESKTADGGARSFRFGEVEVEGRLKSPQIVYFLRRVRAEFAAGDLGHRSFVPELRETKHEPVF